MIKAKDIESMGARNIDDVLETVPGLHVTRSKTRNEAVYVMRGIQTQLTPQILFLINGVNVENPTTGARAPHFKMNVSNISRIEIIRGPGSAVYGADAFSGVINIITKDADEIAGTNAGVRAGSFDSNDLWVLHGGEYGGWKTAFSMEYSESDGDDGQIIESDLQTTFDLLYNTPSSSPIPLVSGSGLADLPAATLTPTSMNTQYRFLNTSFTVENESWKLWLNSWNMRDTAHGPGAAQAVDPVGRQENDMYTVSLNYHDDELVEFIEWDVKSSYNYLDQQATFQLFPPGARILIATDGNLFSAKNPSPAGFAVFSEGLWGNPGLDTEVFSLESSFIYTRLDDHRIRLSLGFNSEKGTGKATQNFGPGVIDTSALSLTTDTIIDGTLTNVTGTPYIFMDDVSRQVRYVTLQDEWNIAPDWELTAGVRYDDFSDFGHTTNPRLALVWATDYNLTTKVLYGRAFRAPAYNELYFKNNPSVLGNPNVKPETIDMLELVFDYRPNFDVDTVFNFFRYQMERMIDFTSGTAENEKDQDGYGLEAEVEWRAFDAATVFANYAWQLAQDSNTGYVAANAPQRQATMELRLKVNHSCSLSPVINWVADRRRAFGDTRAPVDDYTLVDLTTRCSRVGDMPIELAASIRNLTDTDAREPMPNVIANDLPLPGRSVYIEASYHFDK